jgi:hypothetical protein
VVPPLVDVSASLSGSNNSAPSPSELYEFSGGEKHHVFFPATTEQNIARVLFRKPSVSFKRLIDLKCHIVCLAGMC